MGVLIAKNETVGVEKIRFLSSLLDVVEEVNMVTIVGEPRSSHDIHRCGGDVTEGTTRYLRLLYLRMEVDIRILVFVV